MKPAPSVALLLGVLLTVSATTAPRQPLTLSGSFIAAAVTREGVVLGTDTRATFTNDKGDPFGYVDGLPKLFVINRNALATAGAATIGEDFLASFIRRNQLQLLQPVDVMLSRFFHLLPVTTQSRVMIIAAGNINDKPTICMKSPAHEQCQESGIVANKASPILQEAVPRFRSMSAAEGASLLKRAIEAHRQDPSIGGPISLLHISPTGSPTWLEGRPTDAPWPQVCDMVRDYRSGRAQVGLLQSRELLERHFNANCPGRP